MQDGVGVSVREVLQQFGLELGELNLETVLAVHELFLGLLEVGFLDSHDHGKELVLKTRLSDDEVDDGQLQFDFATDSDDESAEEPDASTLMDEVEQFLREQGEGK